MSANSFQPNRPSIVASTEVRSRFKKWALPFIEEHEEITLSLPFEDRSFFEGAPLYLEIGSGKGDFIVSLAERNPDNHYLAVERDVSSLGTLAKKIVEKELKNVKIVYQDFDKVYEFLHPGP